MSNNVTNTTTIGSVTGQVHAGSGDIIVSSFTSSSIISTKEEFLSALRVLRAELETAHQQGLLAETAKQAASEIEAAENEAVKDSPKSESIAERLEKAKAIIVAGAGIATAAATATTAIGKLIPLIDMVIKHIGQIFP